MLALFTGNARFAHIVPRSVEAAFHLSFQVYEMKVPVDAANSLGRGLGIASLQIRLDGGVCTMTSYLCLYKSNVNLYRE